MNMNSGKLKSVVALFVCILMMFNLCPVAFAGAEVMGVELFWTTDFAQEWAKVDETTKIFDETAFEPSDEVIRYFDVKNTGDLAISYVLDFVIDEGIDTALASVIDVYVKNDITANVTVADMGEKIGTLAEILADKNISSGNILPDGEDVKDGYANKTRKIAVALKMQDTTEYFGKTLNGFKVQLTATEDETYTYKPTEKFTVKFPNKDKYLYRVGNMNTVALGSLFAADNAIGAVNVTIDTISGDARGSYSANTSDWTKGTIQFTGTGSVKVTITDSSRKTAPTTLYLEVVNAENATSATSAKSNNVVLLNDVGFSIIDVSGGYTLYGNGFTMRATNDVMYDAMNAGFVTLTDGILDNVQIICPNFSHSVIYKSNITEDANEHAASSDPSSDAYGNVRSAIMIGGNSIIRNSYVHGGRAALFVRSGNTIVENSTISGGAAANIHTISAKSITLRDVTMIQRPFQATVHDTSKVIMGFSGLFECDENGASTPVILEGTLVQDAWIKESYSKYIPSSMQSVISNVLTKKDYLHDLDGDGTAESLNLGFTYIPQTTGGSTAVDITDNRTNKDAVPYSSVTVSVSLAKAQVYSYESKNGTLADFVLGEKYSYVPYTQGPTSPVITFEDTNADCSFETVYKEDSGWTSTLTANLDNGDYTFDFSKLKAMKNGKTLDYTVKEDGVEVDKNTPIVLNASSSRAFVLTVTDGENFGANGEINGVTFNHTVKFNLVSTKSAIPEPVAADTTGGTPLLVVKAKNSDWTCAIPALEGIKIKYYTSANNAVTLDLASLTPTSTGKQNGTNNYWEYSNGYKLKVSCGYIHDTKQIYGMPVVVNNSGNKMYFVISSTNGYVSTNTSGRTVTITYEFTDPNSKTLTFTKTWQFNYADYKNGKQYAYSNFVSGTLKEASSGICLVPGTKIMLADGTTKNIEDLNNEDEVVIWDFFNGEYGTSTVPLIYKHDEDYWSIVKLIFEDGTEVGLAGEHGFYNLDSDRYVFINEENVETYVGDSFIKASMGEDGVIVKGAVKLTDYEISTEYTECYTLLTAQHDNCIADGILSVTPHPIDGYFDIFKMGDNMQYDMNALEEDIEKYGLYDYDVFEPYFSYEDYIAFGCPYFKFMVEKGDCTFEELIDVIIKYYLGDGSERGISVMPMSDEVAEIVITSGENSISTATYGITASIDGVEVENGSFTVAGDSAELRITATGNAKSRHAKITVDGDAYYTIPLLADAVANVTIKNAKGQTATIEAVYGTHTNEAVSVIDLGEFTYTVDGASITFSNTTKRAILDGFDVFVALFGDGNQLLDIATKTYTEFGANTQDTFAPELKSTAGVIKTFIWRTGTMIPYEIKEVPSIIPSAGLAVVTGFGNESNVEDDIYTVTSLYDGTETVYE